MKWLVAIEVLWKGKRKAKEETKKEEDEKEAI
jgi:hypothetical protein